MKNESVLEEIVIDLYRNKLFKIGEYRLTSGKISPYYIDLRILPSYYDIYSRIIDISISKLKPLKFDIVVGIESAGIIHASFIACRTRKPVGYVRKKPKQHGTRRLVEGIVTGKKVLVVDDVATTGGSLEHAVNAVRSEGGTVEKAFVFIDRQEGARERLRRLGVELVSLMNTWFIINVLVKHRIIDEQTYYMIKNYLDRETHG
ncbi:orotate phosphoribosyltransferase [Staphylothermus hellenicus]|uniref:Orotate phosphoribosyltransferase n=1 Tax=Staphylothermus hellenicus (strain DSM 12710 / JCM 10830 / BK20S6-10-b1 / P8) TaxID=591019 RepID=D7DB12_STAHD|nr:orotate phosphoribosyltransferase [Staphylothermus hellenicus]ADI31359.1 orotate phosphoribosyltransferase [Staphylothermus hellenicus DSM 12710]